MKTEKNALQRQDNEIKVTLYRMQQAIDKNNWKLVYSLNKHLRELLKDRREYTKYKFLDAKNGVVANA